MKKTVLLMFLLIATLWADKVKTIKEIRINHTIYPAGSYLEVSSDLAIYLTNEGENKNKRVKKAIRTPEAEESQPHVVTGL